MLAALYNIPTTDIEFNQFSFHNADQHRLIINGIEQSHNISLPFYPIDPITLQDLSTWANIHQALHVDFTQALGIVGSDFSVVDVNNPAELSAWIYLHATEHTQAAAILGLG